MSCSRTNTLIAAAFATSALVGTAQAAVISWDAPQEISGPSDVSTNGTGLLAFNVFNDGSSQTVNGVTFSNDGAGSDNDYAYSENGITVTSEGFTGDFSPYGAFGNAPSLSGDYLALVRTGAYDKSSAGNAVITFTGLETGQTYEIQFWVYDARSPENAARTLTLDGDPQTLVSHSSFVTGQFTADGTEQEIQYVAASSSDQFNAIQLRQLPVPEPSTLALIGLGGLMIARRRRDA